MLTNLNTSVQFCQVTTKDPKSSFLPADRPHLLQRATQAAAGPRNPAQARIHEAAIRLFAEKGATQVTVSELAEAAGMARGTIYNNLDAPDALFERVAAELATEMHQRVVASFAGIGDPAARLANGIRYFLRRAHQDPSWGRFISRFALSTPALQALWDDPPMYGVLGGIEAGRFKLRPEQLPAILALLAGGVLAAILLVLEGRRTWRDAGADIAELVLRGLGVTAKEARKLATAELPPLPELK